MTSAGTAERRWTGRTRGGRLGNLFFAVLVRMGGLRLVPFFVFWVALYFLLAAPGPRRISFDLADRLGQGGSFLRRLRFAFRHFYTFGTLIVDRMAILGGQAGAYRFERIGTEHIFDGLAQGRGVILVTAHLGNWEVMGHLLAGLDAPVTLVMYDGVQPEVRAAVERLARGAFEVLYTDGSPASAAAILQALARGRVVGMMGDRLLGGRGAPVRFLGADASFPLGPYVLAAAAKAPIVHVFAVRRGPRSYSFHGFPAGTVDASDRRRRDAALRDAAAAFVRRLEEFVRTHPEQWGNFYPFWAEAPAPEPAPGVRPAEGVV